MRFYQSGKPIAKQRHRAANGKMYDPKHSEKIGLKWSFAAQFRQQGYLKPLEGPIGVQVDISSPIPKSWSKKRKRKALGSFVKTKPDLDNIEKFYFDVLNKIAYKDDSQIASISSQKRYGNKPGIEINLFPLEDNNMINEHAIAFKDKLSLEDLNYIIKKANRLGLNSRQLTSIYKEEGDHITHVYFVVEGIKEK